MTGVTPSDIQKIVNLKHAWEFILDKDIIAAKSDYHLLSHIARLVNEGFYEYGGRIRGVPVITGGTEYTPPIPMEADVKNRIALCTQAEDNPPIDTAIDLCLYCMKTHIFNDGNKRASILLANHYLIGKGEGLLVIPESRVSEFRTLLIAYYEGMGEDQITEFLKRACWRTF
ncbi:MAG TPA: Fic family protein [Sphaerochaeta sp.]|nr:Fic family protein [Sphaerochaeta sp.]